MTAEGYEVTQRRDGTEARVQLAGADAFDLVLLDVMLPWEDGLSLARKLRQRFPRLPILFLTAKTQPADVVAGFAAGGNDYLRKPFSLEELIVRIENLVGAGRSRSKSSVTMPDGTFALGGLVFDYRGLALLDADTGVERARLSNREADVLRYLAEREGDTVDRRELLRAVWHDDGTSHSRTLDVYARRLRRVLAMEPRVELITLRGVGYRFVVR